MTVDKVGNNSVYKDAWTINCRSNVYLKFFNSLGTLDHF